MRPEVKLAILERIRDRTAATWEAGPLTFRDRAAVPPRDVRDGPWRVVPGGTAVRRGAYLGDDVVVMPPSYVTSGRGSGRPMIDSHVLVGSCAQIGARVHLAAGVTIGGVLEPPGARPVIVEDDAFVGAGSALLDGVLLGRRAVIGAKRDLTGTSRLYDLVRASVSIGTADAPLAVRCRRRARRSDPRRSVRSGERPVDGGRPARQGPRSRHGHGRPRGRAAMSVTMDPPDRPRRGRPPARNEILRSGGWPDSTAAGRTVRDALYVYDLDVIDRQVAALRTSSPCAPSWPTP